MKTLSTISSVILFAITLTIHAGDNNTPSSNSTSIIQGSIADGVSGESLAGVMIKIEGTNQIAFTDFDGNYQFASVKPGVYSIIATMVSYAPTASYFVVKSSASKSVNIKMHNLSK